MTTQIKTSNDVTNTSRWKTLKKWLTAVDEGLNYDPQEYTNARFAYLLQKTTDLEARVGKLEGRTQEEA